MGEHPIFAKFMHEKKSHTITFTMNFKHKMNIENIFLVQTSESKNTSFSRSAKLPFVIEKDVCKINLTILVLPSNI